MLATEIMQQLAQMGSDTTRAIFLRHGAPQPLFGVKVQDLKTIQKQVKKNYTLSKELYSTGNSDAMYLAGLIADEKAMTREDLQHWAEQANWYMLSEYTVAWVTAESTYGLELAMEWIESEKENIASSGWATLASIVSIRPDHELDKALYSQLLDRVQATMPLNQNRVKYTMNGFVIAVGAFLPALTEKAKAVASAIGKVQVDMGGTACKVPDALAYIEKVEQAGRLGRKKKTCRC